MIEKLRGMRFQEWGYWTSRIILGAVFIFAATSKISSPQEFADSIAAYKILPFPAINLLALGLPLFEVVCGFLVLTGFFLRIGLLGVLGSLAVFISALITVLIRGLSIDCGCFGGHSWLDSNPWITLLRDGNFFVLAVFAYRHALKLTLQPRTLSGGSQTSLSTT